ncbi:MAG: HDIG domain-containing protein [Chlorobi bacterium]|nr:HDIG domain-containing protein [Chlorobiota bacterium]
MDISKLRQNRQIRIILLLVTVGLIVLMFPHGEAIESDVAVNSIWIKNDLIASITFEILKDPVQIEKEREAAARKVYQVFNKEANVPSMVLDTIHFYNKKLVLAIRKMKNNANREYSLNDIPLSKESFEVLKNIKSNGSRSDISLSKIFAFCDTELKRIYRRGIVNIPLNQIEKDTISVRDGKFERNYLKVNFHDIPSLSSYIDHSLRKNLGSNQTINSAVKEYLTKFIKPNIIFSKEETEAAVKEAINKVPINLGIVNENERIVAKHDRVTPEIKAKIDSYRIAKGASIGTFDTIMQNVGKFLHVLLILIPLIIYLSLFRRKIFDNNIKLMLISITFLFVSFTAFLTTQIETEQSLEYLILVPVASMLLTIVFDSRIGFYSTVVIALIVSGIRGNDYMLAITNIAAGGLAAYTVRDIKNRNQIFHSFLFVLLGYVLSIIAFGLERIDSWDVILNSSAYALSNSLLSPALTFGLIIFVEKIFGITTELTLFELTDFNSPLLKELANNAPGTFAHSMTIGSMVEKAAITIGASALLARVGAYYHDIGKTVRPEGFVENQLDNKNIHEDLSVKESVDLIIGHVTKGIELAKKYNLPNEIIDFIPMHHGTMVIDFFYNKAKELYGEQNVDINDFRYPGPKPNSKETALLMLADASESAVRSMEDPDPEKVENYVNNLIKIRIDDGQLDDSPLTFDDIKKIKESFVSILLSQHHKRIRYPKQEELEKKNDDN